MGIQEREAPSPIPSLPPPPPRLLFTAVDGLFLGLPLCMSSHFELQQNVPTRMSFRSN